MGKRWWMLPLLIAAAVDSALILHYERSPALAVDRAVLQTVSGPGCEQDVLVRGATQDQLFVIDTWKRHGISVSVPASATFHRGAGLTAASRNAIASRAEVDLNALRNAQPVPMAPASSLTQQYLLQIRQGASWLQGPCMPFANPLQSRLRPVGALTATGTSYVVFRGHLTYRRGPFQLFPSANVWMGIRRDGRLGFEVVKDRTPASHASATAVTIATIFEYPQQHLDTAFVREPGLVRSQFYLTQYHRVLATLADLNRMRRLPISGAH